MKNILTVGLVSCVLLGGICVGVSSAYAVESELSKEKISTYGHVYLRKISSNVAETPFTRAYGADGIVTVAPSTADQNNPYVWEVVERDGFVSSSGSGVGTLQNKSIYIPEWYRGELKLRVTFKSTLTNTYGGLNI